MVYSFKALIALSLFCATSFLLGVEPAPASEADKIIQQQVTASQAETNAWLSLLDKGMYGQSWDQGSLMFRNTIKKDEWIKTLNKVRKPLGSVLSRSNLDIRTSKDPKGLPAGDYMVFFYKTAFNNKKETFELITLVLESDGQWRVLTYQVD